MSKEGEGSGGGTRMRDERGRWKEGRPKRNEREERGKREKLNIPFFYYFK